MKKKSIISIIIILVIVIAGSVVHIKRNDIDSDSYLASSDEQRTFVSHTNQYYTDNSMKFDFESFDGKWSFFDLTLEKNSKVIIKDNSEISSGKLYLVVLDKDYNLIEKKEINGEGNLTFTSEDGGDYLIRVVGKKASGHLDIELYSDNKYSLEYRDFFNGGF